jgi:hypothetical protein
MCDLISIGVKNEPSVRFVTDFWDNPRSFIKLITAVTYFICKLRRSLKGRSLSGYCILREVFALYDLFLMIFTSLEYNIYTCFSFVSLGHFIKFAL